MDAQRELETEEALTRYRKCLALEPECVDCLYEAGWSYWQKGEWEEVVKSWEAALRLDPKHPEIKQYLPTAKENSALVRANKIPNAFHNKIALGDESKPKDGPVTIVFVSRQQSYNSKPVHPLDHYDPEIHSPKSVHFSQDGKKVYVNSLESGTTLVYDPLGLKRIGSIVHKFTSRTRIPLDPEPNFDYRWDSKIKSPNVFTGKPVELALTHGGRYLWAPYYRRSYDTNGSMPSAIAIIDTRNDRIVRVMATGPISKYVKPSPDGKWLAISHWGDNTVGLIDISRKDPAQFKSGPLLTVGERMSAKAMIGDRDRNCGLCVRGLVFSKDSRYLFVSRMRDGGVSVFDLAGKSGPLLMGTVFGMVSGPRDLEITNLDQSLMMSCNSSGYIGKADSRSIIERLGKSPGASIQADDAGINVKKVFVGLGARSIRLSPDEKHLFVSVNQTGELVAIDVDAMKIEARITVDSFPVGLDISPDGSQLWVTSQGRDAKGGNSVGIFQVRYRGEEAILKRTGSANAAAGE